LRASVFKDEKIVLSISEEIEAESMNNPLKWEVSYPVVSVTMKRLNNPLQRCFMVTQVDAVFEKGVLRPLQSLPLEENQQVTLTIHTPDDSDSASFTLSPEQWDSFCQALDAPPKMIPELRTLLQSPGLFDER
jgi:predicted DNA-binding antitoxin AbrB/MazE fold protein